MEQLIDNILAQGLEVSVIKINDTHYAVKCVASATILYLHGKEFVVDRGETALEALKKAWEQIQEIEK